MRNIIILLLSLFLSCENAFAKNLVTNIFIADKQDNNIITIDLEHDTKFKIFRLANPSRLVVDIDNAQIKPTIAPISSKLITKFRHGIRDKNHLRIVFEIDASKNITGISKFNQKKGLINQLIIDVKYKSHLSGKPAQNILNSEALGHLIKPVIVIDAGHGGEDPGTIGKYTAIQEKDITLRYAKTLAIILEKKKSYNVILTRDKDEFVNLADRVAKAKQGNADLFISLHADSHADPAIQGVTVYTLSEEPSKQVKDIEKKLKKIHSKSEEENREIKEILLDLVDRKNKNIAIEFASSLINKLGKEVKIVKNSHRFAGFKVLRNEEVPAVLIELGYLSNKTEEKLLNDDKYKTKIINAMVQSIDHHFKRN